MAAICLLMASGLALAADSPMDQARAAYEAGEWPAVIEAADRVATKAKAWPDARTLKGRALLASGKPAPAEEAFLSVLSKKKKHVGAIVGLGLVASARGDVPAAEGFFKAALKLDKKSVDALRELGRLLSPIGRGGEARTHLFKAFKLDPSSLDTATLLVEVQVDGYKDYAGGIKTLETLLEHQPKSVSAHLLLADVAAKKGDLDLEVDALTAAVDAGPDLVVARGRLAARMHDRLEEHPKSRAAVLEHYARYFELGGDDAGLKRRFESMQAD